MILCFTESRCVQLGALCECTQTTDKCKSAASRKITALATVHLSMLGCSLSGGVYFVWQCWKVISLRDKCRRHPRQDTNLEERLQKIHQQWEGKAFIQVLWKQQLTQIATDGNDLQSFFTVFRYRTVPVVYFLLNCPFVKAKERHDLLKYM